MDTPAAQPVTFSLSEPWAMVMQEVLDGRRESWSAGDLWSDTRDLADGRSVRIRVVGGAKPAVVAEVSTTADEFIVIGFARRIVGTSWTIGAETVSITAHAAVLEAVNVLDDGETYGGPGRIDFLTPEQAAIAASDSDYPDAETRGPAPSIELPALLCALLAHREALPPQVQCLLPPISVNACDLAA